MAFFRLESRDSKARKRQKSRRKSHRQRPSALSKWLSTKGRARCPQRAARNPSVELSAFANATKRQRTARTPRPGGDSRRPLPREASWSARSPLPLSYRKSTRTRISKICAKMTHFRIYVSSAPRIFQRSRGAERPLLRILVLGISVESPCAACSNYHEKGRGSNPWPSGIWSLEFGASLDVGCWSLELFQRSLEFGV